MKPRRLWLVPLVLILAGCAAPTEPTPGATFSGPINIDTQYASSATLRFTVSEDGTSLTRVEVEFADLKCESLSAGSMMSAVSGEFPLEGGEIAAAPEGIGKLTGRFTSPTQASGTITLTLEQDIPGSTLICEPGTWEWSAEAR